MANSGIVIDKLTKYYGNSKSAALDNLSITINPGDIYGFLGANGAGKSTTIRLLLNFLQPSSGTASILGYDSVKESVEIKKHVGYLAGDVALFQKHTGKEILDFLSQLLPANEYRSLLEKRFEADLDKPILELSKGNRQKIGIIQAFMHQPEVLILDEPTSGLDPLMQEAFYLTLQEARDRNTTILMSSHNMTEAERICNRIGIIKHGKLVKEQYLNKDSLLTTTTFMVSFKTHKDLESCKLSKDLVLVEQINPTSAIFKSKHTLQSALKTFSTYNLTSFATKGEDLEDEFLEFYGDNK